jgi:hypothetical protein
MSQDMQKGPHLTSSAARMLGWAVLLSLPVIGAAWALAQESRPAVGASAGGSAGEGRLSDYRIIWDRNVFLSTRRAAPTRVPGSRTVGPTDPRASWTLRGILAQYGGYVAIFENTGNAQTALVHPGEKLLGAVVSRITLDGVVLDGKERVPVGSNMLGTTVSSYVPIPASAAGNAGAESILERLRRRRAAEVAPPPPPATTEEQSPVEEGDGFMLPEESSPDIGFGGEAPGDATPDVPADTTAAPANEATREN